MPRVVTNRYKKGDTVTDGWLDTYAEGDSITGGEWVDNQDQETEAPGWLDHHRKLKRGIKKLIPPHVGIHAGYNPTEGPDLDVHNLFKDGQTQGQISIDKDKVEGALGYNKGMMYAGAKVGYYKEGPQKVIPSLFLGTAPRVNLISQDNAVDGVPYIGGQASLEYPFTKSSDYNKAPINLYGNLHAGYDLRLEPKKRQRSHVLQFEAGIEGSPRNFGTADSNYQGAYPGEGMHPYGKIGYHFGTNKFRSKHPAPGFALGDTVGGGWWDNITTLNGTFPANKGTPTKPITASDIKFPSGYGQNIATIDNTANQVQIIDPSLNKTTQVYNNVNQNQGTIKQSNVYVPYVNPSVPTATKVLQEDYNKAQEDAKIMGRGKVSLKSDGTYGATLDPSAPYSKGATGEATAMVGLDDPILNIAMGGALGVLGKTGLRKGMQDWAVDYLPALVTGLPVPLSPFAAKNHLHELKAFASTTLPYYGAEKGLHAGHDSEHETEVKYAEGDVVTPQNYKVNLQPYYTEQPSTAVVKTPDTNLSMVDFISKRIIEGDEITSAPQKKVTGASLVENYTATEKSNLQDVMSKEKYYKKYNTTNKADVTKLQTMLTSNGYKLPKYGVDGYFGDETKKAFSSYIKDKHEILSQDFSKEESKKSFPKSGCAEYVSYVTSNKALGDAWTMEDFLVKKGNKIKYNIYTDPRFEQVHDTKSLIKTTEEVKKTSKATADMFQVGDAVGLFYKPSSHHLEALKNGIGTYNTHAGVVTSIKNGVPIISHNINGKLYHQPYNQLTIGWIGESGAKPVLEYQDNVKKENKKITDFIPEYANDLTSKLAVNVDPVQVQKDIYGILKVESDLGKLSPTKNDKTLNKILKSVIGEPSSDGNMSIGPGKIKLNSLTSEEQKFLNLTPSKLEKPDVAVKTATYIYLKNYNLFQNYAKQNPQLQLTDDDVRLLTILAYNQGTSKLQNFGYNRNNLSFSEELQKLRDLKTKSVDDISSTKYKYIPVIGRSMYKAKYPQGHESYIKRVLKYGNEF